MELSIAITGAAGFVGRATVDAALRRGHRPRAIVRRDTHVFGSDVPCIALDLATDESDLIRALDGVDAVIHCAGALRGDRATLCRDTVRTTEVLLRALGNAAPKARLVLVSSITVYDADAREIDEHTALDPRPDTRDLYAQAKLMQEACLRAHDGEVWIARPGAIFGPGHMWNAHLGVPVGPVLMRLGNKGEVPVISVENCAEALVLAAQTPVPGDGARALNLVESDLPDRARYLAALGDGAPRYRIAFPAWVLSALGATLGSVPWLAPHLPGLLRPRTLRARMGAKSFSNARTRHDLGWSPRPDFETAMRDAQEGRQ